MSLSNKTFGAGRKHRVNLNTRLLLGFAIYTFLLVGCFAIYQYMRESRFKANDIDGRLQIVNARILDALDDGADIDACTAAARRLPFADIRISIIDSAGRVMYDNTLDSLPTTDHRNRREIRDALETGHGYTVRRHSESTGGTYFYSARRGNGYIVRTAVPYSGNLRQMLNPDNGFVWYMGIVALLMVLLGYAATLPIAARRQREKERLKKQLTDNINHELKTPVAAMRLCLETLRDNADMDPERRKDFIDRACSQCERLGDLLADIATISRLENPENAIHHDPLDLAAIIRSVTDDMRHRAENAGIAIEDTIRQPLTVCGDRKLLETVFRNLIDNAIIHSHATELRISGSANTTTVTITVSDNGTGVDSAHLPHLFERFYRADAGRVRHGDRGTGLGLAIVKNTIMSHGGTVSVTCNGGLTFTLTLPRR